MRDFTLERYEQYLLALVSSGAKFLTFSEFLELSESDRPDRYVLIRHDVDRKPQNALTMAALECNLGLKATYYFRDREQIAVPEVMRKIESLGHEVGYHYECLSDTNGNMSAAYALFEKRLCALRETVHIKTVSMHGSPLKPYDNRDMWRNQYGSDKLASLNLLGEVYLAIDYSNVAYVNDTGRNWLSGKANRRDKVTSNINAEFESSEQLLTYFKKPHNELVFQIHPERWSNSNFEWVGQLLKDRAINLIKLAIGVIRP